MYVYVMWKEDIHLYRKLLVREYGCQVGLPDG